MNRRFNRLILGGAFLAVATLCLSIGLSYLPQVKTEAQSLPSSKATVQVGNINVFDARLGAAKTTSNWTTVMSGAMKTSSQKDMVVTASMETGLYTRTLVSSKNGVSDSSSALAGVEVCVVVDEGTPRERTMYPGTVVFGRRTQTLTAVFQGLIDGCLTTDPLTGSVIIDPLCVQPETLELVLDTMNANSFSFMLDDMGSGVHTMKVKARMQMNTTVQTGDVEARCTIGNGSMMVEEVRLVKGMDITM
jgi:hypothetical protein